MPIVISLPIQAILLLHRTINSINDRRATVWRNRKPIGPPFFLTLHTWPCFPRLLLVQVSCRCSFFTLTVNNFIQSDDLR